MLAPVGASKRFKNVEARSDAGDEVVNVWAEGEVRVEGDPQAGLPPVLENLEMFL